MSQQSLKQSLKQDLQKCAKCGEERFCVPFSKCDTTQIFKNNTDFMNGLICKKCHNGFSHDLLEGEGVCEAGKLFDEQKE